MLDYINPTNYKLLQICVTNLQVFFFVKWFGFSWQDTCALWDS